ncbi:hypothetical protein ILYODFUR_030557, partial [Ilyodon furcidens]
YKHRFVLSIEFAALNTSLSEKQLKEMHHHAVCPLRCFYWLNFDQTSKFLIGCHDGGELLLLLGWLPAQKAQQDTCNESWMVDFSLSTLICDADEPEAHPSPPKHTQTPNPHLWTGSLKGKKIKFRFQELTFQMVLWFP